MSKCEFITSDVKFLRECLNAVENVHVQHLGKLLLFLVKKFILSHFVGLTRIASRIACHRLESVIKDRPQDLDQIILSTDLSELLDLLRAPRLARRFARLVTLLNKISMTNMELSPIEADETRTFNPASIANTTADKTWFLTQLRKKCCASNLQPIVCANLLSSLQYEEIVEIMQRKEFCLSILCHGLKLTDSPVFKAAKDVMVQHVAGLVSALPNPIQVFHPFHWAPTSAENKYSYKLEMSFQSEDFRSTLVQLLQAVSTFLSSDITSLERNRDEEPQALVRFCILGMEYVKWLAMNNENKIQGFENHLHKALSAAASMFQNQITMSVLCQAESQSLLVSAILSLLSLFQRHLKMQQLNVSHPDSFDPILREGGETAELVRACIELNAMFTFLLEDERRIQETGKDLTPILNDVILGLSRVPLFTSYLRIPTQVWKMGLELNSSGPKPTMFPILPVDMLQEIDILQEYVRRSNKIGWITRQQFEENWVSYLGIFSISRDDLPQDELKSLSHCSATVLRALSAVLLQSTYLPRPGQLNTSSPIHYARDSPSQFLLSPRGQQLTTIQNFIQNYIEKNCPERQFLKVDCSMNLERCVGANKAKLGFTQVSVSYIMSAIRHCEENAGGDNTEVRSNKSQALALPFLLREESLAALGIDVQSCLHFLFDLYGQFLSNPVTTETPLVVLTETVRSVLMLSDLFTETSSFWWMLDTFSELHRVHPTEDDIMSGLICLGLCKAVSVTSGEAETMERTRKVIEICLRNAFLPSRICALYGVLYILQSEWIQPEEVGHILPMATDYLNSCIQVLFTT